MALEKLELEVWIYDNYPNSKGSGMPIEAVALELLKFQRFQLESIRLREIRKNIEYHQHKGPVKAGTGRKA